VRDRGKSLAAGRLYEKYIGETERNFRRAIDVAESCSPAPPDR
jgi:hypothetical protein